MQFVMNRRAEVESAKSIAIFAFTLAILCSGGIKMAYENPSAVGRAIVGIPSHIWANCMKMAGMIVLIYVAIQLTADGALYFDERAPEGVDMVDEASLIRGFYTFIGSVLLLLFVACACSEMEMCKNLVPS